MKDDFADDEEPADLTHSAWFLSQFDEVIASCSATVHPKIHATVQKAADLWESGEKVLVFAFYRHTCRALRIHISNELEKRLMSHARRRLAGAGRATDEDGVAKITQTVQDNFFDRPESPGRRSLDEALKGICEEVGNKLPKDAEAEIRGLRERIARIMRGFLRVETTLIRAFPLHRHDVDEKERAVAELLNWHDESGLSWRDKFSALLYFLIHHCSDNERENYLAAAETTETGRISVRTDDPDYLESDDRQVEMVGTLANVRVATGETPRSTRSNLMRSFNTPFFPDILVCSQVMGEGVDLHRYCRHVIHHDLDWNPSSIEQRTGRVDRLGCKAESRHPIPVYVPYLAGTADERQYRVMTDRESWFRIVMGQEEVARLISEEDGERDKKPPASFQDELIFQLDLQERSGA